MNFVALNYDKFGWCCLMLPEPPSVINFGENNYTYVQNSWLSNSRLLAGVYKIIKYFDIVSLCRRRPWKCRFFLPQRSAFWSDLNFVKTMLNPLNQHILPGVEDQYHLTRAQECVDLAESSIPVWDARLAIVVKEDAVKPGGNKGSSTQCHGSRLYQGEIECSQGPAYPIQASAAARCQKWFAPHKI